MENQNANFGAAVFAKLIGTIFGEGHAIIVELTDDMPPCPGSTDAKKVIVYYLDGAVGIRAWDGPEENGEFLNVLDLNTF